MKKLFYTITIATAAALLFALTITDTSSAQAVLQGGVEAGVQAAHGEGQPTVLFGDGGVITSITNIMLFIVGALSVIMVIWGGIRYAISGGNSAAVTSAKNTIMYAIIGLVVAFLAFAIVNFVLGSLTPGGSGTSGTNV